MEHDVELLVDDHHGIYIPQIFCQRYNFPENFINYDEVKEDIEFLAKVPKTAKERETYWNQYWDRWIYGVEDRAKMIFTDKQGAQVIGTLYGEGGLWFIPNDLSEERREEFFGAY